MEHDYILTSREVYFNCIPLCLTDSWTHDGAAVTIQGAQCTWKMVSIFQFP